MASNNKKPIILKRMILKPRSGKLPIKADIKNVNQKLIKLATIPLYREDVIFESNGEAFLPGEYQSVTIMNKLNNLTSNCQTIAHCVTRAHEIIVKTSDNVTQVIGPEAYNSIFYALCSVINQEYRIKAILSLLTATGSSLFKLENMGLCNKACQTDETRLEIKNKRSRKRVRRVPVPYAVKPDEVKLKKVTVVPHDSCFNRPEHITTESVDSNSMVPKPQSALSVLNSVNDGQKNLPDLGSLMDLQDDSNDSLKSFSTFGTFNTLPDLLLNPISLVDNVEKHTKEKVVANHRVPLTDGTELMVPYKPEDIFHIASAENLRFLDEVSKKKLLLHQMHIDFKYCLNLRDEDGNLPIHMAVINGDIPLLKRQCVVLNIRNQSVDIPTTNGLTALKLSIFSEFPEATSVLLAHGADPCLETEALGAGAHLAAERRTDHLAHILNHCRGHARTIITNHVEELQTPGWGEKTDEELGTILLQHLCSSFDKQGYTPLMLASKLGIYENARLLAECAPGCVSLPTPTSGDTALYLAVSAACSVSAERGNKSKVVDHYRKTVEILLDAGADPSMDNNYGSNVNTLLQEFNCAELSMIVANKVTHNRFTDEDFTRNFDEFILLKEGDKYSIQEIKTYGRNNKKDIKIEKDVSNERNDIKIEETKTDTDIIENEIDKTKDIDSINNVAVEVIVKNEVNDDNNVNKDAKATTVETNLNDLVAKGIVKLFSKDAHNATDKAKLTKTNGNKPVITENILLKKPTNRDYKDNPDKAKPICKIDKVTTVKKVIFYPNKRKINDNDASHPKMKKA